MPGEQTGQSHCRPLMTRQAAEYSPPPGTTETTTISFTSRAPANAETRLISVVSFLSCVSCSLHGDIATSARPFCRHRTAGRSDLHHVIDSPRDASAFRLKTPGLRRGGLDGQFLLRGCLSSAWHGVSCVRRIPVALCLYRCLAFCSLEVSP